ncbi:MAG: cytochrome c, partial [Acidobacteriia bacterium]|nr:cytochrome c [Terriglobia bacterium]
MSAGLKHFFLGLACVLLGAIAITGQQPAGSPAGPYTAQQAVAGRTIYQTSCAGCHGADLGGQGNAAPLTGGLFIGSWGDRTTSDLVGFLQGAMPPNNPGSLGEEAYLNVVAFLLDYNGARPGNQPLTAANKTTIRSVATGQIRQVAQAGAPAGRGGQGRGGRGGAGQEPLGGRAEAPIPATPRGLIVPGEVKNYTPITDAMLRNPDP